MLTDQDSLERQASYRLVGRIPVRNLWLLYLYAADLATLKEEFNADVESAPDLPALVARLLCHAVESRLRRNLSRGYRAHQAVLSRVRGRIAVVPTITRSLLDRGAVECRFEDHTLDTPRNRLVRAALVSLAGRVEEEPLRHRCRQLEGELGRAGVVGVRPTRVQIAADRIGRHDAADRFMVALAQMVFDLIIPCEDDGRNRLTRAERDQFLVRRLFEKAIGNFFALQLREAGVWKVHRGRWLDWQTSECSDGIPDILPRMQTDIVLESQSLGRRIVIDTKFTGVLTKTQYREAVLKSGYLYQMYAYLRSQEKAGEPLSLTAEGLFIHPTIGFDVDEDVRIQGHKIRFSTLDLTLPSDILLQRLGSLPFASRSVSEEHQAKTVGE